MNIDNISAINRKMKMFNLPLEFAEAIKSDDEFTVRAIYTWPKCYNALLDYLIIDTKSFSNILGKFSLTINIDNNIITKASHVRLFSCPRFPKEKTKLVGIKTLLPDEENKAFKSGIVKAEEDRIYIFELKTITVDTNI
jgi:hypothetical protein